MTSSTTWLITGTSRGIGLELVKQLVASSDNLVVATCRNPDKATALQSLRNDAKASLHILPLDVADPEAVRASVKSVQGILGNAGLDYLYNNAGIKPGIDDAFEFDHASFLKTLETNVAAPALISQVYLPLLEKGRRKVIVNVTSGLAGFAIQSKVEHAGSFSRYIISKAALNMLTYKQARARPEIITIVLAPGWTKTDLGGERAPVEVHESVTAQIKIVTGLTLGDSGKYLNYTGEELAW